MGELRETFEGLIFKGGFFWLGSQEKEPESEVCCGEFSWEIFLVEVLLGRTSEQGSGFFFEDEEALREGNT